MVEIAVRHLSHVTKTFHRYENIIDLALLIKLSPNPINFSIAYGYAEAVAEILQWSSAVS